MSESESGPTHIDDKEMTLRSRDDAEAKPLSTLPVRFDDYGLQIHSKIQRPHQRVRRLQPDDFRIEAEISARVKPAFELNSGQKRGLRRNRRPRRRIPTRVSDDDGKRDPQLIFCLRDVPQETDRTLKSNNDIIFRIVRDTGTRAIGAEIQIGASEKRAGVGVPRPNRRKMFAIPDPRANSQ